jgi:hypothetical protein
MANQEVDLSFMHRFKREMEVVPSNLWLGGVEIKHQMEPQMIDLSSPLSTHVRIKRMVIPTPIMDSFMNNEIVSFKLEHTSNTHALEGECCLHSCMEGHASNHYRALEDVLLTVRVK